MQCYQEDRQNKYYLDNKYYLENRKKGTYEISLTYKTVLPGEQRKQEHDTTDIT